MNNLNQIIKIKVVLALLALFVFGNLGCNSKSATFSMMPAQDNFKQSVVIYKPSKVDILWVVDNSNSMLTSQGRLASSFESFINRFETLNYDFHMAVTQTDAWKTLFDKPCIHDQDQVCSRFKDGHDTHSGIFIMDKNTPNLTDVFTNNVMLGTFGSGDERSFQSMQAALENTDNAGFRRPDAFLAVIIVSDEDDFSGDSFTDLNPATLTKYSTDSALHYLDPLHSIQKYVDFLDQYTGRSLMTTYRNYSVSAITVANQDCVDQLSVDGYFRYPGVRHLQLAEATGGVQGNLCDDFGATLDVVSESIIAYSSIFPLDRVPNNINTVQVMVDGVVVPQDATSGWTYLPDQNSIQFHGTAVPKADAQISINYDPSTVKM